MRESSPGGLVAEPWSRRRTAEASGATRVRPRPTRARTRAQAHPVSLPPSRARVPAETARQDQRDPMSHMSRPAGAFGRKYVVFFGKR